MRDLLPQIEHLPWPYALPVVTLTLAFCGLLVWVRSAKRSQEFEAASRLPLAPDGVESIGEYVEARP